MPKSSIESRFKAILPIQLVGKYRQIHQSSHKKTSEHFPLNVSPLLFWESWQSGQNNFGKSSKIKPIFQTGAKNSITLINCKVLLFQDKKERFCKLSFWNKRNTSKQKLPNFYKATPNYNPLFWISQQWSL